MNTTSIEISELKELCISALVKKGATESEAQIVFADYLDAEARGRLSHGFISFAVALGAFPHSEQAETYLNVGSVIGVDGKGDCGHTTTRRAIDLALSTLETTRVSVIGVRNITRFNCPGPIARYAAERGAIAIVLEYGGQNFMAPFGGTQPALSTNPIGIAIPGTEPLFVLDIATSERALGYVNIAKLNHETIPTSWGVDKDGNPTDDPSLLVAVSPFGGYKGYSLALAFEILSGAFVGVPIGAKGTLGRRGALMFLLHPAAFQQSVQKFNDEVAEFLGSVLSVNPLDKSKPVTYPGQHGSRRAAAVITSGRIQLVETVINDLKKAAA